MKQQPYLLALRLLAGALAAGLLASPLGAQTAGPGAGHSPALKSGTLVTLNFVNADVEAVTRAMGAMLDRQFIVDPRAKGNITVYSETPLTVREAYLAYLAALRGLGFTVVENAGLLKVVPEADAKLQAGTVSIGEVKQRGDQIITQIFRLNHENPNNLVAALRPLISPNNTINANPGSNTLVITDYADNLARLGKIIAALDQPATTDIEVVPLKHALASDLGPVVQRLAEGGAGAQPGVPGASGVSVIADARSNALIVRAANPARQAQVRSIIDKLDLPTQGGGPGGSIWVVHLKNADAVKLAQVLRAAFAGGTGGAGAASGGTPGFLQATPGAAQAGGPTPATAPVQASAGPSTGGFIQADPSTNSLVITAAEPLYRQVRAMIEQLDTRRAQVYIESMIVEVSGDNAADFGFQWQGLIGGRGDTNLVGVGTNFGTGTGNIININTGAAGSPPAVALGEGLNVGLVRNFGGTYALAAIARMLQTQSNINIISTPNLITLDNEEAKIVVGSNVPFITGQFTNTGTGTTNPFQTIERKDVGLTLRIKPQIGEGGTVRMTVFQESSSVQDKATVGTSNAGPSTNKRSFETNVVVDDGSIIVLGGLIEDRYSDSDAKVPLLGDIPLLGNLFRSRNRTKNRTNLMVFLRPVVLRDAASADRLSLDRYDLMRAQQKDSQPTPSVLVPINGAPIAPPFQAEAGASAPASTPKSR